VVGPRGAQGRLGPEVLTRLSWSHEDRDPGAPMRPRIAGQDVKDVRRGSLGGGGDHIFRDHGVIASCELGGPGGMGGRAQDVSHLRRLGQWIAVAGSVVRASLMVRASPALI